MFMANNCGRRTPCP